MTHLGVIAICSLMLFTIIDKLICWREEKIKETQRIALLQKWEDARYYRVSWERLNKYNPKLFHDKSYQTLWNSELGAMDLCEQLTGSLIPETSRHEYREKETQAQLK